MFYELKKMMHQQSEKKDRKCKGEPNKFLEQKIIIELENWLEGFKISLDQVEERISRLEDRSFEIIQEKF